MLPGSTPTDTLFTTPREGKYSVKFRGTSVVAMTPSVAVKVASPFMEGVLCMLPFVAPGLFPVEVAQRHFPEVLVSCTYISTPECPLMAQSQSPFSAFVVTLT